MTPEKRKDLEKQGYRLVGNHSAIKVCGYCKKTILGKDVCYKNTFYGINSNRCVQMTPALKTCTHRCDWCWRDIEYTDKEWIGPVDEPKDIVDGCIKEHVKFLYGFGGNKNTVKEKYEEALKPQSFAISLTGEPTFYPRLPEFISEIKSRKMTTFLVTNGTNPDMLKKLIKNHEPTQLYITLPAPDKKTYLKVCHPSINDGWEKIMQSIELLKEFECRKTIRLTLVSRKNMIEPEKYAEIIKNADADFIEIKAYMWVGYSRFRLEEKDMPWHDDIENFAEVISKVTGYPIVSRKKESRVVLLQKGNRVPLKIDFTNLLS